MVASCRKGQKSQKNNIKAKRKSLMPNSPKKAKKSQKAKPKISRPRAIKKGQI